MFICSILVCVVRKHTRVPTQNAETHTHTHIYYRSYTILSLQVTGTLSTGQRSAGATVSPYSEKIESQIFLFRSNWNVLFIQRPLLGHIRHGSKHYYIITLPGEREEFDWTS